jgi:hypothetical protein
MQGTNPVILHVIHALFYRGAAVPSPHVLNGVFQHAFRPLLMVVRPIGLRPLNRLIFG